MTFADALDMHVGDALWFMQRIAENREAEAQAIKNASETPSS